MARTGDEPMPMSQAVQIVAAPLARHLLAATLPERGFLWSDCRRQSSLSAYALSASCLLCSFRLLLAMLLFFVLVHVLRVVHCSSGTARPELLVPLHVLLVELGCWVSALKHSASVTGAVVKLLIPLTSWGLFSKGSRVALNGSTIVHVAKARLFLGRRSCLARHCCRAVHGSNLMMLSSPDLWLLRLVSCARFGRQVHILSRLGVKRE